MIRVRSEAASEDLLPAASCWETGDKFPQSRRVTGLGRNGLKRSGLCGFLDKFCGSERTYKNETIYLDTGAFALVEIMQKVLSAERQYRFCECAQLPSS